MNNKLFIFFLFTLIHGIVVANPKDTVTLYTWGAELTGIEGYSQCHSEIELTYKIKHKIVGGCIVTRREVMKWKLYNFRMKIKLAFMYGFRWKEKIRKEVETCVKENFPHLVDRNNQSQNPYTINLKSIAPTSS